MTLRTLNIAMLSYCTSVLVLLVIGNEDDVSEKQEAVRMACAEILYRVVCVVAASMLRNACEVVLGNANQVPPSLPAIDNDHNTHDEEFEYVLPPGNEDQNPHELDQGCENAPPPAKDGATPHELDEFPRPVIPQYPPPTQPHDPSPVPPHDLSPASPDDPSPVSPHLLDGPGFPHNTHIYGGGEFVTHPNYRMEGIRLLNRESFVVPFLCPAGDTPRVVVATETNPKCGSDELVTLRSGYRYKHVHS